MEQGGSLDSRIVAAASSAAVLFIPEDPCATSS
jgi:hypothetical protein